MENKISVLIVDDHPLFRKGIRLYLEDQNDIEIVKELSDGEEAIYYLENHYNEVHVIIMDLQMPKVDGETATKIICRKWPNLKILVLTSYGSWDKVYSLLNYGASGYLLKDAKPDELIIAIKAINAGGTYFGKKVAEELLNHVGKKHEPVNQNLIEPLTERELDVLKLIGQGLGNTEISESLHISLNTVKTHVARIFQKLDVNSRTQAAFYAIQEGLIS